MERAKEIEIISGKKANFASPEDVIIMKMKYFKEGGSEKHIRDIAGIIKLSGEILDYDYIKRWCKVFKLEKIWGEIFKNVK